MATRRKKEWFDDESFWHDLYPFMFPEQRFAGTPEQIGKVLTLTNPGGKAALGLCCGPGRCAIALAQRGFRVTGPVEAKAKNHRTNPSIRRKKRAADFHVSALIDNKSIH